MQSPLIISPKNNADVGREILFEWKVQEVGSVTFHDLFEQRRSAKSHYAQQNEIGLFRKA